jgi:TetR/AcrR family transcriptional regulator, regulator of cefoperazone and chloramphenicol sensitivity
MAVTTTADTKELLLRAGERLFARDGIHGARIRELNELAGQRNPSALHYHFGSRDGLVTAIMVRHQSEIDAIVGPCLDDLEARGEPEVRAVVEAVVRAMVAKLETESGRDWARIIPQILSTLSDNLRRGRVEPITPQTHRILELLRARISHLPESVQRERLVDYGIVLSTLMAERAHQVESGGRPSLDDGRFVAHLTDVLVAVVTAPSTVAD